MDKTEKERILNIRLDLINECIATLRKQQMQILDEYHDGCNNGK